MWSYSGRGLNNGAEMGGEGVVGVLGDLKVVEVFIVAPVLWAGIWISLIPPLLVWVRKYQLNGDKLKGVIADDLRCVEMAKGSAKACRSSDGLERAHVPTKSQRFSLDSFHRDHSTLWHPGWSRSTCIAEFQCSLTAGKKSSLHSPGGMVRCTHCVTGLLEVGMAAKKALETRER